MDYSSIQFSGNKCTYQETHKKQAVNIQGKYLYIHLFYKLSFVTHNTLVFFSLGPTKLHFTYEVSWEESNIRWASRWDIYLAMTDVQIHWFSTINSVVVVFFLSGMLLLMILFLFYAMIYFNNVYLINFRNTYYDHY